MASLLPHDVAGAGPPVCLLHSGVCDRRMWEPQWPALAERFRVVRPDMRGFGEAPLEDGPLDLAGDVLELFDQLGMEGVALVGSSLGGRVALEVAERGPTRVARLVLLCPGFRDLEPSEDARAFADEEEALLERGDRAGVVELNVRTWLGPDASEEVRELVREMQGRALDLQLGVPEVEQAEPPPVDLSAIAAPAVVVAGGRDLAHFRRVAEHLARELPDARLVRLEWAGHLPTLERPGEMAGFLLEALSG